MNPNNGQQANPGNGGPVVVPGSGQVTPSGVHTDSTKPNKPVDTGGIKNWWENFHPPDPAWLGPDANPLNHDVNNPTHSNQQASGLGGSEYSEALKRFTQNAFGDRGVMAAQGMSFSRFAEIADLNKSMVDQTMDLLAN